MSVQLGNVISNNIYFENDKPLYRRGNTNLVVINFIAIFLFLFAKAYYVWENGRREKIWNQMTDAERQEYRETSKVVGSRRLDFRFAH